MELEGKEAWGRVEAAASAQEALLQQINQQRAEWGHPLFTLTHLPHHQHVQVEYVL